MEENQCVQKWKPIITMLMPSLSDDKIRYISNHVENLQKKYSVENQIKEDSGKPINGSNYIPLEIKILSRILNNTTTFVNVKSVNKCSVKVPVAKSSEVSEVSLVNGKYFEPNDPIITTENELVNIAISKILDDINNSKIVKSNQLVNDISIEEENGQKFMVLELSYDLE